MLNGLLLEAAAMQEQLVAWRRHIHQNPEVGMETAETAAYVKARLEEMGYQPDMVAGTGVCAVCGGQKPGPCFLLRADMDALPVEEKTGLAFSAASGGMHACGHDLHTAMLLGAAKLLKAREGEIPGRVKLVFQPGEENLQGAAAMIQAGVLETPRVDAAAMIHVSSDSPLPPGTVILPKAGPYYAASDWFEIVVMGKGGHGAQPQNSVDPLNVMSHLHLALQALNSREADPAGVLSLTVGVMQGGTAYNVIPEKALMGGTVRTYDSALRQQMLARIPEIAQGVAVTFRAEAETRFIMGCPPVVNSGVVIESIRGPLAALLGDALVEEEGRYNLSEDFSYIAERVPAVLLMMAAGAKEDGRLPLHHPRVVFDEGTLARGAAVYAATALAWLQSNG